MAAQTEINHRRTMDLTLFLVLALVCRVLFQVAMPRAIDTADAIHYLYAAEHIYAGEWLEVDPKVPILYPLLVASAHTLIQDWEGAGRAVSLIFSCLLIFPVYLLSNDLHGRSPARIAALLVAIWPWLMDYGSRISTEALGTFLWVLAVWLLSRALRRDAMGWSLCAAIAFSALHLSRPEGTFILLASFIAAAVLCGKTERKKLRKLVPFGVACASILATHALYMKALVGHATINHRLSFIGDQPEDSTVLVDFVRTFVAMSTDVPSVMLGPLIWMLAGYGVFFVGGKKRDWPLERYVLFFAFVQWCVVIPVLSPAPRYLMSFFVVVLLWAARGVALLSSHLATWPKSPRLHVVPVAVVVALMLFQTLVTLGAEHIPGRIPREPREYKIVGEWMRDNLDSGLIMSRKPQVGYYARMASSGPMLSESLEAILQRAREEKFRYLVVDERYSSQMVPALAPLLDPANAPNQLRVLHDSLSPYPQARVVVYEFSFDIAPASPLGRSEEMKSDEKEAEYDQSSAAVQWSEAKTIRFGPMASSWNRALRIFR